MTTAAEYARERVKLAREDHQASMLAIHESTLEAMLRAAFRAGEAAEMRFASGEDGA